MVVNVEFNFKARYFKSSPITSQTKAIWFVLHGYGQLAEYFLQKFKILDSAHLCVIAPEALSKFYLQNPQPGVNRNSDRVGASWMTKENRLVDIENYITYLDTVYQTEISQVEHSIPITILGFSQGCATACRWIVERTLRFNKLILWAGIFPHDMDINKAKEKFLNKKIVMVYGTKDQYLTDSRFSEMKIFIENLATSIETFTFDGGHEIDQAILTKLLNADV